MTGTAADVEHGSGGCRQMFQQLVVHHIGAHVPLDRGIRLIDEQISQTGPGVIGHHSKILDAPFEATTDSLHRVSAASRSTALLHKAVAYGPSVLRGRSNFGTCSICEHSTLFVETGAWLRDQYLCVRCGSIPRWRALLCRLDAEYADWRDLAIHESSPGGPASDKLRRQAAGYSSSQYLGPDVPPGSTVGNVSCQDLCDLTFDDGSFDLFITQDVLEHVLRPDLAVQEIARVLKPGGAHVFTVPIHPDQATVVRAVPTETGVEHLLPPEYHGNPVDPNGSLVVREWGIDLLEFISLHCRLQTEAQYHHDRRRGPTVGRWSPS